MKNEKSFSRFIQGGLKSSSISLRKLCREAGTDPSFLSKVLRGKLPPPVDEKLLKRMAQALGLDPLTLIISTGRIPMELRSDPETLKKRLEGRAAPQRVPVQKKASVSPYKSPHLSEDLL